MRISPHTASRSILFRTFLFFEYLKYIIYIDYYCNMYYIDYILFVYSNNTLIELILYSIYSIYFIMYILLFCKEKLFESFGVHFSFSIKNNKSDNLFFIHFYYFIWTLTCSIFIDISKYHFITNSIQNWRVNVSLSM